MKDKYYCPAETAIVWDDGTTDKVFVQKGHDWENKKSTIIFTGLNNVGTAVWGKKD